MNRKWRKRVDAPRTTAPEENRYTLAGSGFIGRGCKCVNAVEIEAGYHYNGGGPNAFGGAKMWPHITVKISFQEGQDWTRDRVVLSLKKFLDVHV